MSEPTIAVFLLQRFCRDDALVGDILEEFGHRQSRAWLWRQVAVVVLLGLPYGLMKEPPKGGRMPMPVGGIGLLAATGLVTIVAPGAWWVGAIAVVGGLLIGAVMIVSSRRRVLKGGGRRNILLPLVLAAAVVDAAAQAPPKAAVRIDPVEGIVEAFKTHQVVMLPGGHGSKPLHDLLLAVVRDPRMPGTLTDIVVEFGSSRYQDLIDRFVRGDAMPDRAIGAADFTTFVGANGDRFAIRGADDFVKIPRDQHTPMRMDDQVDAILWMGVTRAPTPALLSKETCADPEYLPMRLRRIAVAGLPQGEADAARRACAVK